MLLNVMYKTRKFYCGIARCAADLQSNTASDVYGTMAMALHWQNTSSPIKRIVISTINYVSWTMFWWNFNQKNATLSTDIYVNRQCKVHVMFCKHQKSKGFRNFIFYKMHYVIPLDLINCYKNNNNFEKILANPSYVTKMT